MSIIIGATEKKSQEVSLKKTQAVYLIGAGIGDGQPTEEALVRGGRVLLRRPVAGHVKRIRDHQLSTVKVGAEHKRDFVHPADDGSGLGCHLPGGRLLKEGKITARGRGGDVRTKASSELYCSGIGK